jgi:hypothetical protein
VYFSDKKYTKIIKNKIIIINRVERKKHTYMFMSTDGDTLKRSAE